MCVLECTFNCLLQVNPFWQTVQTYGFSPVCVLMWITNWPDWMNVLEHTEHLCGLSPVWILMCLCSLPECSKAREQTSHLYGLSLVWMRLWTLRFSFTLKLLLQNSHLKAKFNSKQNNSFAWFREKLMKVNESKFQPRTYQLSRDYVIQTVTT